MNKGVASGYNLPDSNYIIQYEEISRCPLCKVMIEPVILAERVIPVKDSYGVRLAILCLCKQCGNSFVAQYAENQKSLINRADYPKDSLSFSFLEYASPDNYVHIPIDLDIAELSPNFAESHTQAQKAEHSGLDQVAGLAYRKALECLVKDFLAKKNPEKKLLYENAYLKECIENYTENEYLKNASKSAVWLSDDQTNFLRHYEDKDIVHLKKYIDATVHWIKMILITDEASDVSYIPERQLAQ